MQNNTKETIELLSLFLYENYLTDEDDKNEIIKKFIEYYNKHQRHQYHAISKFVSDKMSESEDSISYILNNIEDMIAFLKYKKVELMESVEAKSNLKIGELILNIEKIYDHVALEEERIKSNSVAVRDSNERIERNVINTFNSITDSFQKKVDEISNSLNANIITVVGLFSAIIFVFFGGITTLSSFVNGILEISNKEELLYPILALLIVGFIIFNTIFLLLYTIAKIVNKNIGSVIPSSWNGYYYCEEKDDSCYLVRSSGKENPIKCFNNKEKAYRYVKRKERNLKMRRSVKRGLRKTLFRFPYVTIINMILIFGIIFIWTEL